MERRLRRTFPDAITALLGGRAIYRESWPAFKSIALREGVLIPAIDVRDSDGRVYYWVPLQEDLFATDWRLHNDRP